MANVFAWVNLNFVMLARAMLRDLRSPAMLNSVVVLFI
jgi:hypothetical protein